MQTVFETRRARLKQLIAEFGTIAALNEALGWESTNARLSQIQNRSTRSDRGTAYEMGDTTAREIETTLKKPVGWMDTPLGYVDLTNEPIIAVLKVMESMPPDRLDQFSAAVVALANPASEPGTSSEADRATLKSFSTTASSPRPAKRKTA